MLAAGVSVPVSRSERLARARTSTSGVSTPMHASADHDAANLIAAPRTGDRYITASALSRESRMSSMIAAGGSTPELISRVASSALDRVGLVIPSADPGDLRW